MFPLPLTSRARNRTGFTLLELLIVITIIAILASILLAVFGTVQNRARKVQAVNDMRSTKVAVIAFYTDYQRYPLNSVQQLAVTNGDGDTIYGDPGGLYTSADLFNILRAVSDNSHNQNNICNPNQTVYWSGTFAKSASKPREGITTQDVTVNGKTIPKGSLVDPWGNCYIALIDADRSGEVSNVVSYFYSDAGAVKVGPPPQGIVFCSMGPDGVFGTKVGGAGDGKLKNSDDIVTWQ